MQRALLVAAASLIALLTPRPAAAWGFAGHRLIMTRALDLLPPELKAFVERYRTEIVVRVVDPDTWRNVGWDDDPNHFIDFGMPELGPYPFDGLPRDYDKALEKFGPSLMKQVGFLPWREAEMFGNLRRAFEGFKRQSAFGTHEAILFSAPAS